MKCKECGQPVLKIMSAGTEMVCNGDPVTYWHSNQPNASILTPNGETIYCVLKGKPEKAHGIGYTLHTCFEGDGANE